MSPKINYFRVEGFFGNQDVILNFINKENIYIGENGLGKTTILNLFFYTIKLNFIKIQETEFKKITIGFEDGSTHYFLKKDIESLNFSVFASEKNSSNSSKYWRTEFEHDNYIKYNTKNYINTLIDDDGSEHITFNYKEKIKYFNNLEKKSADQISESRSRIIALIDKIEDVMKNIDILYFPTYRRIEEDISNFRNPDGPHKNRNSQVHGELIEFGMSDVEDTIEDLIQEIKKSSIESFNQMTGILLKQYVTNDLYYDKHSVDFSKIDVILDRVGDKIDAHLRSEISELITSKSIYEETNTYLLNFLVNLIISYKEQEQLDNRIRDFVDICNNYLVNKEYKYNESTVELKVYNNKNKSEIKLSNLSSGEKQIISTFSKIYLEQHEQFIILFDEPELSLSLRWQERFLPDILKSGKCNLLIAVTHSPFIFEDEKLFDSASSIADHILFNYEVD